jgi:acyl carrier protein
MQPESHRMIAFIADHIVGRGGAPITPQTPLVSSGLIDSCMLVEVLIELERVAGLSFPPGTVDPENFETVDRMMQLIDRLRAQKNALSTM